MVCSTPRSQGQPDSVLTQLTSATTSRGPARHEGTGDRGTDLLPAAIPALLAAVLLALLQRCSDIQVGETWSSGSN